MTGKESDDNNFSRSRNRLLIQRFYHEIWNRFDKSILSQLLTEDIQLPRVPRTIQNWLYRIFRLH
jgi:hypothetical protein